MPKTTKKAAAKAVSKAPAKSAAPEQDGTVLKRAFPSQDADGLKLIRRHLRKALRANAGFKFHKIGTRWVFPTKRDVDAARKTVQPYLQ